MDEMTSTERACAMVEALFLDEAARRVRDELRMRIIVQNLDSARAEGYAAAERDFRASEARARGLRTAAAPVLAPAADEMAVAGPEADDDDTYTRDTEPPSPPPPWAAVVADGEGA